jgi:hypothetical protein
MAFELTHQSATLKTVTPRKEAHGDSKVTAVSFGLKFTAPNTLLDHLSPSLRTTLYKPAAIEGQEPLEGVDEPTPLLRTRGIETVKLVGTLEGWTVQVDHGIDEDDPMTFGGCKLDAFSVAPMEGGTVELHLRVGTSDIDAAEIGLLCDKLQEEIVVSITAPKPMEPAIDGSPDGGGPGFSEPDDAGDLFAAMHGQDDADGEGSDLDVELDGDDEGAPQDLEDRLDAALAPRTELPRTIKYRSPHTGETWSGRGQQPRWIKAALAGGQSLEDFAVEAVGA